MAIACLADPLKASRISRVSNLDCILADNAINRHLMFGGSSVTPMPDEYSVPFVEWQPISYGLLPTLAWLQARIDFIDQHMRAGHGLFVHCDAGADRSAFVMSAYLMWRDGIGHQEAIEVLRKKLARRCEIESRPVGIAGKMGIPVGWTETDHPGLKCLRAPFGVCQYWPARRLPFPATADTSSQSEK